MGGVKASCCASRVRGIRYQIQFIQFVHWQIQVQFSPYYAYFVSRISRFELKGRVEADDLTPPSTVGYDRMNYDDLQLLRGSRLWRCGVRSEPKVRISCGCANKQTVLRITWPWPWTHVKPGRPPSSSCAFRVRRTPVDGKEHKQRELEDGRWEKRSVRAIRACK